jgi:hypothetical protein
MEKEKYLSYFHLQVVSDINDHLQLPKITLIGNSQLTIYSWFKTNLETGLKMHFQASTLIIKTQNSGVFYNTPLGAESVLEGSGQPSAVMVPASLCSGWSCPRTGTDFSGGQ